MNIEIPETVADQLLAIANEQQKAPAEIIVQLVHDYAARSEKQRGSFEALAQSAAAVDIRCDSAVNTAARSREILTEEYADHIKRKQRDNKISTD